MSDLGIWQEHEYGDLQGTYRVDVQLFSRLCSALHAVGTHGYAQRSMSAVVFQGGRGSRTWHCRFVGSGGKSPAAAKISRWTTAAGLALLRCFDGGTAGRTDSREATVAGVHCGQQMVESTDPLLDFWAGTMAR